AAAAAREVVLHEPGLDTGGGADVVAPALEEVAPGVAVDGGREEDRPRHVEARDGDPAQRLEARPAQDAPPGRVAPAPDSRASSSAFSARQRLTSRETSSGRATGACALLAGLTSGARRRASS